MQTVFLARSCLSLVRPVAVTCSVSDVIAGTARAVLSHPQTGDTTRIKQLYMS